MQSTGALIVPRSLEEACDPRTLALVVYDMQVGILRQIADRDNVVAKTQRVLGAARAAAVRTFFMRHVTLPTALMGVAQLRMWMAWQRVDRPDQVVSPFPPDASETQIAPEVQPTAREAVFDKITMSAFEGTPLDIALRDSGVITVAIVGVALEVGIEPTVRHAADLGYVPIVVTDACGAGDSAAGRRSLETLAFAGDALLANSDQFSAALASASR